MYIRRQPIIKFIKRLSITLPIEFLNKFPKGGPMRVIGFKEALLFFILSLICLSAFDWLVLANIRFSDMDMAMTYTWTNNVVVLFNFWDTNGNTGYYVLLFLVYLFAAIISKLCQHSSMYLNLNMGIFREFL